MYKNHDEALVHWGIKGMHWGVRRFQNVDGSLTTEGKSRYRRGKEYEKERTDLKNQDVERQKKLSKEYQEYTKESERLVKKYRLDPDDGGGGDHERFSDKQLENAGRRYWEMQENMDSLMEKFESSASKRATEKIVKKYGEKALSDIKHYNNVNSVAFLGSMSALAVALFLIKKKR